MENQIFRDINTGLDLNGPILSYITQPTGPTGIGTTSGSTGGASVELVGIATISSSVWSNMLTSPGGLKTVTAGFNGTTTGRSEGIGGLTFTPSSFPSGIKVASQVEVYDNNNVTKGRVVIDGVTQAYVQHATDAWVTLYSGSGRLDSLYTIRTDAGGQDAGFAAIRIDGVILEDGVKAPGADVDMGSISYQWYNEDGTKVENGTYITGAATTTLTLSNLITPNDNNKKFYVQADYIPTYSGIGGTSLGTGYRTGNAINDPINSELATVTVTPMIEIISQPSSVQREINTDAIITVIADLTDSSFTNDLQYQWYLNGEEVSDGTKTVTTTTGEDIDAGIIENTYTSPNSHTVPAQATDIEVTIAGGKGGDGGSDAGGPGGGGGGGRAGRFTLSEGAEKALNFYVGKAGNGGSSGKAEAWGAGGDVPGVTGNRPVGVPGEVNADGGPGGGAGNSGWSGGGGGGGAASIMTDDHRTPLYIIIAGGGGGGGGGSLDRAGGSGPNGAPFTAYDDSPSGFTGSSGYGVGGDGGGGGGAGGGALSPRPGGAGGRDREVGGSGGYGGYSSYDQQQATLQDQWHHEENGYINLKYKGKTETTVTTTRKTTLSGTNSNILTLQSDIDGVQTLQCKITSETASNSSIWSNLVTFAVVDTTKNVMVNIEEIGITDTANLVSINLENGEYTFNLGEEDGATISSQYYVLYSPDNDIEIEMDLYGGKGKDWVSGSVGGEGGYSRIQFTLEQNVEYVIAGLTKDIQAPFLYRKGVLMAVVGGGGAGGPHGDGREGGLGGGVNVIGSDGTGSGAGKGGTRFGLVELIGQNGIFGSIMRDVAGNPIVDPYAGDSVALGPHGNLGGKTISCTKGRYWAQQGKGACDDLGKVRFRLQDGTEVTNTSSSITRGFKAGYNIMQTAGKGKSSALAADGGNGAWGGEGGWDANGGGGGGSGYLEWGISDAKVIDNMQGGSTGDAKVIIRLKEQVITTPLDGLYKDAEGRICILACVNLSVAPNDIPQRNRVEPGTVGCVNDTIWQYILGRAADGTEDWRLTARLPNGTKTGSKATERNIWRMMNANRLPLRNSLTGWVAPNSVFPEDIGYYNRLVLAWDETSGREISSGDYSLLWWVHPAGQTNWGWGYYGGSSNPFFEPTTYHHHTAEWWILPPGVPDF